MLKKLQRRFVIWTSLAIFAVIALIVLIINLSYRNVMIGREEDTIDAILSGDLRPGGREDRVPDGERPPGESGAFNGSDDDDPEDDPDDDDPYDDEDDDIDEKGIPFDRDLSPEAPFMTRFFTVQADGERNITSVSIDNIGSVSEDDAREMAEEILAGGSSSGYTGEYRYRVQEADDGYNTVFLNCSADQESMASVLFVSSVVGLVSVLFLILVVFIISGRVIKPYVRNARMQRQFITDAEHELKTPITSISTSADVLLMDGENEWLRNIKDQAEKMNRLVAGMLKLSRMDEEDPFPDKAEFSLSDAAWEASEPFGKTAEGLRKSFTREIEDDVLMTGDEPAVQQLISILLDNAVKYSDSEGNIVLKVYKDRKHVCIDVSNTGDMSAITEPERLFDRFFRPDESRSSKTGGYGIGLSIARAVAESHNGTLTVRIEGDSITFSARME